MTMCFMAGWMSRSHSVASPNASTSHSLNCTTVIMLPAAVISSDGGGKWEGRKEGRCKEGGGRGVEEGWRREEDAKWEGRKMQRGRKMGGRNWSG
jgi:hypothetical protein